MMPPIASAVPPVPAGRGPRAPATPPSQVKSNVKTAQPSFGDTLRAHVAADGPSGAAYAASADAAAAPVSASAADGALPPINPDAAPLNTDARWQQLLSGRPTLTGPAKSNLTEQQKDGQSEAASPNTSAAAAPALAVVSTVPVIPVPAGAVPVATAAPTPPMSSAVAAATARVTMSSAPTPTALATTAGAAVLTAQTTSPTTPPARATNVQTTAVQETTALSTTPPALTTPAQTTTALPTTPPALTTTAQTTTAQQTTPPAVTPPAAGVATVSLIGADEAPLAAAQAGAAGNTGTEESNALPAASATTPLTARTASLSVPGESIRDREVLLPTGVDARAQPQATPSATAPAHLSADTAPTPLTRQPLVQALGQHLQVQISNGSQNAVIRLDPPFMGSIDIVIRHEAGAVQVHLSASNSEVLTQLQNIGDALRQDLGQRHQGPVSVHVSAGSHDAGGRQRQTGGDHEEPGRALNETDEGDESPTFDWRTLGRLSA